MDNTLVVKEVAMTNPEGQMLYQSIEEVEAKCSNFEAAAFADITPHIWGYCFKVEWPFSIAIFKQHRDGAFMHEKTCEEHKKDFEAWHKENGS